MNKHKFDTIENWLIQNSYSISLPSKWKSIRFSNENKLFHTKFLDVVKSQFGDISLKDLSICWNEHRLQLLKDLDAPECLIQNQMKNLLDLKVGKGRQCMLASLIKTSKKKVS